MPTAKKKPATKKTTTKRPVAPRKTVSAHTPRPAQPAPTFLTVRPTIETIYWIVLGVVVIGLVAWVLRLTTQIDNLYNQVEINNATNTVMTPTHKPAHETKK